MATTENTHDTVTGEGHPTIFRIFLASPGDVPLERKLARETIAHVNSERRFRGRIDIEIIAWDQPGAAVAMEAGLTPQQAISQGLPKPEDCDLAVIILWSRIGTQLPADFDLKEDQTPYLSGTEWEYLNAIKGFNSKRNPGNVWVFRRTEIPKPALDDPDYQTIVAQWDKLKQFFATFTNPDGTLKGGINHYETPNEFRLTFEHYLRDRLEKLLESLPTITVEKTVAQASITPRWTESPYPGLEAFTPEQAPIYFGRGREVDQLLRQFEDPKVRFVAVVGVSGSGKSSLVKAGLLPRLRAGIVGHAPWLDMIFKPGERGANPYLALAFALKARLKISDQTESQLAAALQADPNVAQQHLTALLAQAELASELLLVVDQFEELFTQCTDTDRQDFLALLEHVVTLPRIRAIVTLRADFYARAITEPILANLLRQDRGSFPLDLPGTGALYEMITRPAEAAGMELQDGLAQRLLDQAGNGPGAMALMAYTLNQLYEQEHNANYLSIDAYNTLGGVEGAIQKRADVALSGLKKSTNLDTVLPELFAHLVEVNEQEVATRRRALQKDLTEELPQVADALTEARLLVTGKGEKDQPTLEVAHETVLSGWDRLQQWIIESSSALRARRDLEQVASEWEKSGRPSGLLRTGPLLQRYQNSAKPRSATAKDYLTACKTRQMRNRVGYFGLAFVMILLASILFHVNKSDYPPSLATKALVVELGLWPVAKPHMVKIPAGQFEMGDLSGKGNPNELPVHTVSFATTFEMGQYEVTFAEYDLFAAAAGLDKPSDRGWGRGHRPVINVSWADAVAYTKWLSAHTGLNYRLPSEAEWEYAARAKTTTTERYWPENAEGEQDAACTYANVLDQKNISAIKNQGYSITWEAFNCEDDYPFTAPVGQFKANDWGLFDMLGNVWELAQDCYIDNYNDFPEHGLARELPNNESCSLRVLRGGSWLSDPQFVHSAYRFRNTPAYRFIGVGFRLARTL